MRRTSLHMLSRNYLPHSKCQAISCLPRSLLTAAHAGPWITAASCANVTYKWRLSSDGNQPASRVTVVGFPWISCMSPSQPGPSASNSGWELRNPCAVDTWQSPWQNQSPVPAGMFKHETALYATKILYQKSPFIWWSSNSLKTAFFAPCQCGRSVICLPPGILKSKMETMVAANIAIVPLLWVPGDRHDFEPAQGLLHNKRRLVLLSPLMTTWKVFRLLWFLWDLTAQNGRKNFQEPFLLFVP